MFLLQTEQNVMNKFNFHVPPIIPSNKDLYIEKFYSLPDIITLPVNMGEYAIFPDIFLEPYPMVSEMVMEVMEMYRIELFYKRIYLSDQNSGEYKVYFLLCLDQVGKALFNDLEIKRTPQDATICIISLEFAESLLRRGARGIELVEIY